MPGRSRSVNGLPSTLVLLATLVAAPFGCDAWGGGDDKRGKPISRERGGDPPTGPVNPGTEPPLIVAARAGDAAKVRDLMSRGAEINAFGTGRQTALMAAAQRGHAEVVTALLEAGADANLRDAKGDTAAEAAAARGHKRVAESLRQAEVKPPKGPARPVASPKPPQSSPRQ